MRRKTAKEILAESFRELAQSKTVDAITVGEIVQNCGYSTATFYRQFRDKYDLIAWEHAQRVSGIMARIGSDGYTWKKTLLDGARMFEREKAYLANLLRHTSGHDSFVRYKTEINYNALRNYILKISGKAELGACAASPQELADAFERALPPELRPYLLEQGT